ncbi:MAG TPA: cytochrome b/b6 domain-containing protein [Telmatospirillum sp.]|nr:cytochrome b/b6 domain-containing protein [Telmatospirillum sp.]
MKRSFHVAAVAFMMLIAGAPQSSGAANDLTDAGATALGPLVRTQIERHPYSLGAADPARPAQIRKINTDCLACHSEQGVKAPPRPDLDLIKLGGLTVSAEALAQSVHAAQACTTCHGDAMVQYPHPENGRQQAKNCVECHPRSAKYTLAAFQDSRHYVRHQESFTCNACHNPHSMTLAANRASPREVAEQDNAACLGCHQNAVRFAAFAAKREMPDLALHHRWLPNADLHWKAVRCIDCHAEATEAGYSHQFVRIVKATRDCSSCHSVESSLRSRLYRKALAEPSVSPGGFLNDFILQRAYVVGATRNLWLDQAILAVGALLLLSLATHAFFRIVGSSHAKTAQAGHRVYLFAAWIRLWHWINVLLMSALAMSGLAVHFAPARFAYFDVAHRVHVISGIGLCVAFAGFLVGNVVTGNWRQYLPERTGLAARIVSQGRFYLWGIFRGADHPFPTTPEHKFNPMQQIIYAVMMFAVMPLLVISGLLLLFPEWAPDRALGIDGLGPVAIIHFLLASSVILFAIAHLYLGTTGRKVTTHLTAMVTGWHEG